MTALMKLDEESVLRAMPGSKYVLKDLETGQDVVLRCEQSPLDQHDIFFNLDTNPNRYWEESDGPYADVFKHLRPAANEGSAAINDRATFSDMIARKAYRIG